MVLPNQVWIVLNHGHKIKGSVSDYKSNNKYLNLQSAGYRHIVLHKSLPQKILEERKFTKENLKCYMIYILAYPLHFSIKRQSKTRTRTITLSQCFLIHLLINSHHNFQNDHSTCYFMIYNGSLIVYTNKPITKSQKKKQKYLSEKL